jgi:hypothetical protein
MSHEYGLMPNGPGAAPCDRFGPGAGGGGVFCGAAFGRTLGVGGGTELLFGVGVI